MCTGPLFMEAQNRELLGTGKYRDYEEFSETIPFKLLSADGSAQILYPAPGINNQDNRSNATALLAE